MDSAIGSDRLTTPQKRLEQAVDRAESFCPPQPVPPIIARMSLLDASAYTQGRRSRKRTALLLAAGVFVLLSALIALNAFNTNGIRFLTPQTTGEILAFTATSVLAFLTLMALLILLLRNIVKLYLDERSRALGSRLRTRMVVGAAVIALLPAAFMVLFSFVLMNRSVDRWFSQPTSELRQNSVRVVYQLAHYAAANARLEAQAIAASGAMDGDPSAALAVLRSRRITLEGGFVAVYAADYSTLLGYQLPSPEAARSVLPWMDDGATQPTPLRGNLSHDLLTVAQRTDEPVLIVGSQEFVTGLTVTSGGHVVVVGLPLPPGLSESANQIREGASQYWKLFRSRNRIRSTYLFMLLLITALVFFSSMWLALFLSKQITRPVEALADAMDEIAEGKLERRIAVDSSGEMAELVSAFNHMAQDLESSRKLAESASEQISNANRRLDERRRELETILETIPSGVATLDRNGIVMMANRAFSTLMHQPEEQFLTGQLVTHIFPQECVEELERLIRRSRRMGAAAAELEIKSKSSTLRPSTPHLAVTCARLDLGDGQDGTIVVVEDATELLRAQRQMAWKEAAQRIAHEVKNPLTPIGLSAERMLRHLEKPTQETPAVLRKCSEVILSSVASLRALFDHFAALAEFPAPQPRRCEINPIVEDALKMFAGRMDGITLRVDLQPHLPPVMVDVEAIRRSLANLIDNAAEAMQESLLKVLTVTSSLTTDGSQIEIAIGDTGSGLTEEIRERLFLPFYSTKQRGSGLGLSIAAKIAQDHHGSIRAEKNSPKGARFLLCLPVCDPVGDSAQKDSVESRKSETEPDTVASK